MDRVTFCIENYHYENGQINECWPNGWPLIGDPNFEVFISDNKRFNSDMFHHRVDIEGLTSWVQAQPKSPMINLFWSIWGDVRTLDIQVKSLEQISPDEKYIFAVVLNGSGMLSYEYFRTYGLSIHARVLEDCRQGKCKILLHELNEGHGFNKTRVRDFFMEQSEVLNIPLSSFAFLDGNHLTPSLQKEYGTEGFCMFAWETHTPPLNYFNSPEIQDQESYRMSVIENKEKMPYHFISLNRRPRQHRLRLVTHILNNCKDKFIFSCDTFPINSIECFDNTGIDCCTHIDDLIREKKLTKELYLQFPFILDVPMEVNDTHLQPSLLSKAYVNITTETMFYESETIFFSEKIFKPILFMQPFIIVGPYSSLSLLKDMGYKTFHPFINESYDLEQNPSRRMEMILEEIERLSKFTHDEMAELVYTCREILEHNLTHIKIRRKSLWPMHELVEQLKKWVGAW